MKKSELELKISKYINANDLQALQELFIKEISAKNVNNPISVKLNDGLTDSNYHQATLFLPLELVLTYNLCDAAFHIMNQGATAYQKFNDFEFFESNPLLTYLLALPSASEFNLRLLKILIKNTSDINKIISDGPHEDHNALSIVLNKPRVLAVIDDIIIDRKDELLNLLLANGAAFPSYGAFRIDQMLSECLDNDIQTCCLLIKNLKHCDFRQFNSDSFQKLFKKAIALQDVTLMKSILKNNHDHRQQSNVWKGLEIAIDEQLNIDSIFLSNVLKAYAELEINHDRTIIDLLVQKGADVNCNISCIVNDVRVNIPMTMFAAMEGDFKFLVNLIKHGGQVNLEDERWNEIISMHSGDPANKYYMDLIQDTQRARFFQDSTLLSIDAFVNEFPKDQEFKSKDLLKILSPEQISQINSSDNPNKAVVLDDLFKVLCFKKTFAENRFYTLLIKNIADKIISYCASKILSMEDFNALANAAIILEVCAEDRAENMIIVKLSHAQIIKIYLFEISLESESRDSLDMWMVSHFKSWSKYHKLYDLLDLLDAFLPHLGIMAKQNLLEHLDSGSKIEFFQKQKSLADPKENIAKLFTIAKGHASLSSKTYENFVKTRYQEKLSFVDFMKLLNVAFTYDIEPLRRILEDKKAEFSVARFIEVFSDKATATNVKQLIIEVMLLMLKNQWFTSDDVYSFMLDQHIHMYRTCPHLAELFLHEESLEVDITFIRIIIRCLMKADIRINYDLPVLKENLEPAILTASLKNQIQLLEHALEAQEVKIIHICFESEYVTELFDFKVVARCLQNANLRSALIQKLELPVISTLSEFEFNDEPSIKAAAQNAFIATLAYNQIHFSEHPELANNVQSSHLADTEVIATMKSAAAYIASNNITLDSLPESLRVLRGHILDKIKSIIPQGEKLELLDFINTNTEELITSGSTNAQTRKYFSDLDDEAYAPAWRWVMSFQENVLSNPVDNILSINKYADLANKFILNFNVTADAIRYLVSLSKDPNIQQESRDDIIENLVQQCSINQRIYSNVGEFDSVDRSCSHGAMGRFVRALCSHPFFQNEQYIEVQQQAVNLLAAVGGDEMRKIYQRRIFDEQLDLRDLKKELLAVADSLVALTVKNSISIMRGIPAPLMVSDNFNEDLLALRNSIIKRKYPTLESFAADIAAHLSGKKFKGAEFEKLSDEDLHCIRMTYYSVTKKYQSAITERLDSFDQKIKLLLLEQKLVSQINKCLREDEISRICGKDVNISKRRFKNTIREFSDNKLQAEDIAEELKEQIADIFVNYYESIFDDKHNHLQEITLEELCKDYVLSKKQVITVKEGNMATPTKKRNHKMSSPGTE